MIKLSFFNGGEMTMKILNYPSHNKLLERINWLETAIDTRLSCYLPIAHIEQKPCTFRTKKKVNSQNKYTFVKDVNLQ